MYIFANRALASYRRRPLSSNVRLHKMRYRDADDEYFAVFQDTASSVFATVGATKYPETYRAMFGFCAKTNSLKTAMFDCIDSNNLYAFKVLFRCFCEHYLKFMYLWACFLSEKSDRVGSEYFSFCGALEAQDYVASLAAAERLVGNEVTASAKAAIEALYPLAARLSARELERASGQFKYRSILRFLADDKYAFVSKDRPFLSKIVPTYALLSSFVHGGPYTDLEMQTFASPGALEQCESDVEVVAMLTASVYMLAAAAVSREFPEQASVAPKVNAVIKRFVAAAE